MKKIVTLTLIALIVAGCNNTKRIGPFNDGKSVCREKADTLIAHMQGWKELSADYIKDRFMNTTDRQTGEQTEYYQYVLVVKVSDGQDTLTIRTDDSTSGGVWNGQVWGEKVLLGDNPDVIKRHNIAIKRACGGDTCFTTSINDRHVLSAEFKKAKPKEPDRPIEDYGLTEKDIK